MFVSLTLARIVCIIDAGLHVVKRLAGADVHDKIAVQMDYRTPFLAFKAGETRFDALME